MSKLFKLLKLLKLFRQLRHAARGSRHHHGHGGGYGYHAYRDDHWHPRSRAYHPLYRRSKKPKLKHLVRDLLASRRY